MFEVSTYEESSMRRNLSEMEALLPLNELKNLMFWAKWGIENAQSGTGIESCTDLISSLDRQFRLQVGTPKIGKWRKRKVDAR